MTQEDKELLSKDICVRLLYGLKCKIDMDALLEVFPEYGARLSCTATLTGVDLHAKVGERVYTLFGIPSKHRLHFLELDDSFDEYGIPVECVKPYLRPMSSMTEEERNEATQFEINNLGPIGFNWGLLVSNSSKLVNWLNAHHFDYHGLIEKGLALEAPEDMYKTE